MKNKFNHLYTLALFNILVFNEQTFASTSQTITHQKIQTTENNLHQIESAQGNTSENKDKIDKKQLDTIQKQSLHNESLQTSQNTNIQNLTDKNITITGDKMSFQQSDTGNVFDLLGNIKVVLPIGELTSDELHLQTIPKISVLSFDCIVSLIAEKNVKLILEQRTCTANKLTITPKDNLLLLTGNVKIIDPMATITGEEIRVNYITREIEMLKASNQKQQVSLEINANNIEGLSSLIQNTDDHAKR